MTERRALGLLLYLSDAAAVAIAFFFAYYLRNFGPFRVFLAAVQPLPVYLTSLPFAVFLFLAVFYFAGLYRPTIRASHFTELYTVIKATTLWILLIMAGSYLSKYDYSRIIVVLLYVFTLAFAGLGRAMVRFIEQAQFRKGEGVVRILIVGAGRPGRDLARRLQQLQAVGYEVVGFLDDSATNRQHFPVIGKLAEIGTVITQWKVHEVYITDPKLSHETILDLMARVPQNGVRFKVASNLFDLVSGGVDLARIESIPSLDLWRVKESWWSGRPKRIFDLLFASLMLLATVPLWAIVGIAIVLNDGRPILLRHERVGLNGKGFMMWKFRTMKQARTTYEESPRSIDDGRITTTGRLLRKTSLDELPQLVNIVKGEMSIVGPRPEMPHKVAKYKRWQRKRLEVKPGLTGLWQILGRKDLPLEHNLEYDFYYINNQSFLLDMTIILKTIPVVLRGKGAY